MEILPRIWPDSRGQVDVITHISSAVMSLDNVDLRKHGGLFIPLDGVGSELVTYDADAFI